MYYHVDGLIHGEGVTEDENNGSLHGLGVTEDDNHDDGHLNGLLHDLHTVEMETKQDGENQDGNSDADPNDNESFFKIAMKEAKRQLYPGCNKFSRLSFVVKLLHMKSLYRLCNSAFSAILKLLSDAFPECNTLPKSYYEAKTLIKELGLGYESIHILSLSCINHLGFIVLLAIKSSIHPLILENQ